MKKIMLGLVAAFALASFAAPVYAEDGADAPKAEKKAKKGKKAKKDDAAAPAADAPK